MSSHGRRRPGPEPAVPAQVGWALLVIAAALIGGLAAAALVHTSLTVAVIVSVVAGGIAVLAVFRSPARPPELMAGEAQDEDSGRYPAARRRQAPPAAQVPPRGPGPASRPGRFVRFFRPRSGRPDPVAPDPVAPDPVAPDPVAPIRCPIRSPRSRPGPAGGPAAARPRMRPSSSCCPFRRSREMRSRPTRPGGTRLSWGRRRRVRGPSGRPLRTCPPTWRPPLSRSARAAARSGSTSGGPGAAGTSAVRPASTPGPGSLARRGHRSGSCPGGEGSDVRRKGSRPPATLNPELVQIRVSCYRR